MSERNEAALELPPMPATSACILKLLDEVETTPEALQQALSLDPALTSATLRLVNSALFGAERKITSLSTAVLMLGFLRLRSLAIAMLAAGLRNTIPDRYRDHRDRLWSHSVNVAIGARLLAERAGLFWSEEAFVAGLLHDCGRVLLLARETERYAALLDRCSSQPEPTAERDSFGVDHVELGGALLRGWEMPAQLIDAASLHHAPIDRESPHAQLLAVVVLADCLLDGSPGDTADAIQILELPAEQIPKLIEEVRSELQAMRGELLNL